MLQAAKIDNFNLLVPKSNNSECLNLLFSFKIKQLNVNLKLSLRIFIFVPSATALMDQVGKLKVTQWQSWELAVFLNIFLQSNYFFITYSL